MEEVKGPFKLVLNENCKYKIDLLSSVHLIGLCYTILMVYFRYYAPKSVPAAITKYFKLGNL